MPTHQRRKGKSATPKCEVKGAYSRFAGEQPCPGVSGSAVVAQRATSPAPKKGSRGSTPSGNHGQRASSPLAGGAGSRAGSPLPAVPKLLSGGRPTPAPHPSAPVTAPLLVTTFDSNTAATLQNLGMAPDTSSKFQIVSKRRGHDRAQHSEEYTSVPSCKVPYFLLPKFNAKAFSSAPTIHLRIQRGRRGCRNWRQQTLEASLEQARSTSVLHHYGPRRRVSPTRI